ncbi:MAG: sigma-70 family RNA polymerase sigma factor [Candidatus Pacebacteria bacterium]|nr:sigma-70 family RNA polymerase sigma factor [Candidatus Paceibacterota bacterium]
MKRFVGFTNEQILVEAIKNGHELAIEYWFKNYYQKLYKLAAQKLPSPSIAEEITQETFINCLRSITLFKGDSSLLTYMQSILRHEINDFYRKRYAKKFIQIIPLSEFLLDHEYKDAHETAEMVKLVLKKMTSQSRELLIKKYVDEKKIKELAEEWGRTEKAIESELFRARKEFRLLWADIDQNT